MKSPLILYFLLVFTFFSQKTIGQSDSINIKTNTLKYLDSKNRYHTYYSKFSFYSYYDIVRQYGIGMDYSPKPRFDIDVRLYAIYPYGPGSKFIFIEDYFLRSGAGLSVFGKIYANGSNKGFYAGTFVSIQASGYKNKWYSFHDDDGNISVTEKRSLSTEGITIFPSYTMGVKRNFKNFGFDLFFAVGMGLEKRQGKVTTAVYKSYYQGQKAPYSYKSESQFLDMSIGLKLTYGIQRKKIKIRKYYQSYMENVLRFVTLPEKKATPVGLLIAPPFYIASKIYNETTTDISNYKALIKWKYRKNWNDEKLMLEYTDALINEYMSTHPQLIR